MAILYWIKVKLAVKLDLKKILESTAVKSILQRSVIAKRKSLISEPEFGLMRRFEIRRGKVFSIEFHWIVETYRMWYIL